MALLFVAVGCGTTGIASADSNYSYITITYPGAASTQINGIGNIGQIVGFANVWSVDHYIQVSFVYAPSTGLYVPLPAPADDVATPVIVATGVNDAGVVVGAAYAVDYSYRIGFIYTQDAGYTFFAHPGWPVTEARAVSPTGIVTGYAQDDDTGAGVGFLYDPATRVFTDIAIPGTSYLLAQGINAAGQVVGGASFGSDQRNHAFLRQPDGTLTDFLIDGHGTQARGINNQGVIAGGMNSSAGYVGFVGTSASYQALAYPGGIETGLEAINDAGQVVGNYYLADDDTLYSFVATPVVVPQGTTSAGAFVYDVAVIGGTRIFVDPAIAVGYDFAIGAGDPAFASVVLPVGIGDNRYTITVGDRSFSVNAGQVFDFAANGYPAGVAAFRVTGIERSARVTVRDTQGFPVGLTFVASGRFTGTQMPLLSTSATMPVPGPGRVLLALLAIFMTAIVWPWRMHPPIQRCRRWQMQALVRERSPVRERCRPLPGR